MRAGFLQRCGTAHPGRRQINPRLRATLSLLSTYNYQSVILRQGNSEFLLSFSPFPVLTCSSRLPFVLTSNAAKP